MNPLCANFDRCTVTVAAVPAVPPLIANPETALSLNVESATVTVPPFTVTIPFALDVPPSPPYLTSAYCNVEVPDPVPNVIPFHCPEPLSEVEVNTIGEPDVPTADNDPFTVNVRVEEFPSTVTPACTVNVTPNATVTSPVITYGLFAADQVVFDEIVPETFVGPELNAGPAPTDAKNTASRAAGTNRDANGQTRNPRGRSLTLARRAKPTAYRPSPLTAAPHSLDSQLKEAAAPTYLLKPQKTIVKQQED
jgi:hypothetical protein